MLVLQLFLSILRDKARNFTSRNRVVAVTIENEVSRRVFSGTKQLLVLVAASLESSDNMWVLTVAVKTGRNPEEKSWVALSPAY